MMRMKPLLHNSAFERLLTPMLQRLSAEAVRSLSNYRIDATTQARIDELADKCSDGRLTEEERAEYGAYVEALDVIEILQDVAREAVEKVAPR